MKRIILKLFLKIELQILEIRIVLLSNDIEFLEKLEFSNENYFERKKKIEKYERLIQKASSIITTLEFL